MMPSATMPGLRLDHGCTNLWTTFPLNMPGCRGCKGKYRRVGYPAGHLRRHPEVRIRRLVANPVGTGDDCHHRTLLQTIASGMRSLRGAT
ncbi:MAG: hypothetical protein ACYCVW_08120 [Rhodocyclaceae bacterium]